MSTDTIVKDSLNSKIQNTMNDQPLLATKGIYMIYRGRDQQASVVALKGVNLTVKQGEFVAVVGPSGSGKTSLMRIIGGIMHPTAGQVYFEGIDITKVPEQELSFFRRRMVGFVFQEGNLMPNMSAYDNVNQAMAFDGAPYETRKKRSLELLDIVGVLNRKNQLAYRLSGGERQRVAIARALANSPKLIIADEPTGNVDYRTSIRLLELFKSLNKELNTSFLVATHSNTVAGYASRNIELRDGMMVGLHGKDIDLSQLDLSRIVIMDTMDNRITIPPALLQQIPVISSLWTIQVVEHKKLLLTPLEEVVGTAATDSGPVEKHPCPVCGEYNPSTVKFCGFCGAKF